MSDEQRIKENVSSESPPDPRPLAKLLDAIVLFIRRFVVLSDHSTAELALFVAHTWAFGAARVTPYQDIHSAEEESGKTRLMEVLGLLVPNPKLAADITDSVLFRMIETEQPKPTLFLDEIDAVFNATTAKDGSKNSFRSLINAGYREGGKAYRNVPPNWDYKAFAVFCPKVFAGIGTLPRTTASRTVPHELKRRLEHDEPVEDFYPDELEEETNDLKAELEAWAASAHDDLKAARPKRIKGLRDRTNEVWGPLFVIAKLASDEWLQRAGKAAVALCKGITDEPSDGVLLLDNLLDVYHPNGKAVEWITSHNLIVVLTSIEEAPWAAKWLDQNGQPTKGAPNALAKLVKPYGFGPKKVHPLGDDNKRKTKKGYYRADIIDSWKRLLPPTRWEGLLPRTAAPSAPSAPPEAQSQADGAAGAAGAATRPESDPTTNGTPPLSESEVRQAAERVGDRGWD